MHNEEKWIVRLAALAASSPQIPELVPLQVGFEVGGKRLGLDLTYGRITDGASAQCLLAGSSDTFDELVEGTLTLQRAHVTGRVKLSGEPEGLLRLAFLLDAASALRHRKEAGAIEGAAHA
jgi:hypothetical protein